MDLEKIIAYMKKKHEGQKRYQGSEYYTHPLSVAYILSKKGFSAEYQIAALLHDVVECTKTEEEREKTYEEIEELTTPEITKSIRLVTKEPGYNNAEYMARIKKDDVAHNVKLADRLHNLTELSFCPRKFIEKQVRETEEYYVDLAKGTVFEDDINIELERIKRKLKEDAENEKTLDNR